MAEQIRSTELLIKTALAIPGILNTLKNKPEETLKRLGKDATQSLPRVLPDPDPTTNNAIWLIFIIAFAADMRWAAQVLYRRRNQARPSRQLRYKGRDNVDRLHQCHRILGRPLVSKTS